MKICHSILSMLLLITLTSCGTITQRLAGSAPSHKSYPAAKLRDDKLYKHPPEINLSRYQSVETEVGRPYQRGDIAIAVAASGGGYRASNLTAGVFMGLEKIKYPQLHGNLLQEVDYFSSVSGGGFTVGYYLSQLYQHLRHYDDIRDAPALSFRKVLLQGPHPGAEKLRVNYADDLFFGYTRSLRLESKLGKNLLSVGQHKELTLGNIFIPKSMPESKVNLPYWIANATIFQNMHIFPFTPGVLAKYQVRDYIHNFHVYPFRGTPKDVNFARDMPMAVGMTASATFPYAVDGTTMRSSACYGKCYLHLFDGGLADNLGVYSALDLLRQDHAKTKILIIVDAFIGPEKPFSQQRVPPRKFTLLNAMLNSGSNAARQLIKEDIQTMARENLCTNGAKKVLVVDLDLRNYPQARHIGTSLWIDKEDQALLFKIGQELVKKNKILTRELPLMLADRQHVGICR